MRQILVSVNDVTSRVLLARELKESQARSQVQMDMLLGLLQVDPEQLVAFLDDTSAALRQINSVLKVPARGDGDFRNKVDQLFREMHRIKGDAATLGIASVESRAHAFEDLLRTCATARELSGNDFLPLVVRLDEMFGHLKSIRELVSRLDDLRATRCCAARRAGIRAGALRRRRAARSLAATLDALAQRIATDARQEGPAASRTGSTRCPATISQTVQDVVDPARAQRGRARHRGCRRCGADAGKDETGLLQVQFKSGEQEFELVFQDDGAGIVADRVREAAVRRGIVDRGRRPQRLDDEGEPGPDLQGRASRPTTATTGTPDAASASTSC